MKIKVSILSTMFVLLSVCNIFAVPNLRLPFQGGERWRCDQGNSTDPSNFVNGKETNQSHKSTLGILILVLVMTIWESQ